MGISELAGRLLAEPEQDGRQPPMGEGDVRSQLYGRSIANNNVVSATVRGDNGSLRNESSSTGPDAAEQPSEIDRSLDAWSRA